MVNWHTAVAAALNTPFSNIFENLDLSLFLENPCASSITTCKKHNNYLVDFAVHDMRTKGICVVTLLLLYSRS